MAKEHEWEIHNIAQRKKCRYKPHEDIFQTILLQRLIKYKIA